MGKHFWNTPEVKFPTVWPSHREHLTFPRVTAYGTGLKMLFHTKNLVQKEIEKSILHYLIFYHRLACIEGPVIQEKEL